MRVPQGVSKPLFGSIQELVPLYWHTFLDVLILPHTFSQSLTLIWSGLVSVFPSLCSWSQ